MRRPVVLMGKLIILIYFFNVLVWLLFSIHRGRFGKVLNFHQKQRNWLLKCQNRWKTKLVTDKHSKNVYHKCSYFLAIIKGLALWTSEHTKIQTFSMWIKETPMFHYLRKLKKVFGQDPLNRKYTSKCHGYWNKTETIPFTFIYPLVFLIIRCKLYRF